MEYRSMNNGNGPDIPVGSPVPFWLRSSAYLDARVISITFWDLT